MTQLITPAPDGYAYGFVQFSRAWYAEAVSLGSDVTDEITVGQYSDDGGCRWEFVIGWHQLHRYRPSDISPRVDVFSDAWQAFAEVPALFSRLSTLDSLTPAECCKLLAELGFTDMTKVERAE